MTSLFALWYNFGEHTGFWVSIILLVPYTNPWPWAVFLKKEQGECLQVKKVLLWTWPACRINYPEKETEPAGPAKSTEQEPRGAQGSLPVGLCPSFPSEKGLFKIQWLCSSLAWQVKCSFIHSKYIVHFTVVSFEDMINKKLHLCSQDKIHLGDCM